MRKISFILVALFALAACQRMETDIQEPESNGTRKEYREVIITASIADASGQTRTSYNEAEGKNYWSSGDKIKVFSAGEAAEFTSMNTEPETIVKFKGNIASITGSSNDDEDSKDYVWGLYPYSPSVSYSEPDGISRTARMTLTYTDMQTGVAGSFGDNLAVMIGRSESLAIPFRGAYSGAFFKVNRDDIVSMTLEGLNGEVLAGTATIGLNDNLLPVIYDVADPKTAVTVTAPDGTFEPGANYYIITLPDVPLPNGYKVTLRRSDGYEGTYELRANRPLNRIKFRNLSDPIDVRIESAANIEAGTSTGWIQSTTQGINEIWYTTNDGSAVTYTVDSSTGNEVDEIIAPADNGGTGIIRFKAPITGIDQEAFSGMTTLTSVSLPRTVVSIGAFAFCDCYDMDNVGFGTSLETIGEYAFFNCGFQNLSLPEGITELGSFSFGSNRNLETAYLPSSLESPGSAVFWSCPNLREFNGAFSSDDNRCLIDASDPENMTLRAFATGGLGSDDSYTVPNMIRTIGAYAFSNVSVGSILLPRSLTTIEGSAFFGCHSLKSITIPPGVNKVSGQAFYACDNLEMIEIQNEDDVITADGAGPLHQTGNCPIVVPAKFLNYYKNYRYWDEYKDRYIPSMSDNEIIYMTSDGEAVGYNTEASTGNQVSEIIAPNDNGGVGVIRFIDPLTTIDDMALSAMHNLTEVFLPDCVESIGDSAFEYSEILSSVHLGSGLKLIGTWAFGSTSLTTIDLPEGLEVIGTCAFENCPLTSVTIPESVMYLGSSDGRTIPMGNPFSGCTRLESFSGKFATDDGKALIETIQGNRYFISCVAGNYGETYYVPDVEEISFWAFNSSGMSEIVLPQSLSVIRDGAFMHCSNLVSLMVPPSVEVVGGAAFYGCGSLEWVKIESPAVPRHVVTYYSGNIFSSNRSFPIYVPATLVGEYKSTQGWSVFADQYRPIDSTDEILYTTTDGLAAEYSLPESYSEYASSILHTAPTTADGFGVIKFPFDLTEVPEGLFKECQNLKSVTIPRLVESIGANAFSYCNSLETVSFQNSSSLTTIGDSAFLYCSSLKQIGEVEGMVYLPSVTSVGQYGLRGLPQIQGVHLPELSFVKGYGLSELTLESSLELPKLEGCMFWYTFQSVQTDYLGLPAIVYVGQFTFGYSTIGIIRFGPNLETMMDYCFTDAPEASRQLFFEGTTPPTFSANTFFTDYEVNTQVLPLDAIHVPVGCKDAYKTALHDANSAYDVYFDIIIDDL